MSKPPIDRHGKLYVSGHCGMVGSPIVRCLQSKGYILLRSRAEAHAVQM